MTIIQRSITFIAAAGLAFAALAATPSPGLAKQKGDLLVRLRAVHFDPVADGTTNEIGGSAHVNSDQVLELDFTFFFTDHIAAELILATTRHRVHVNGSSSGDVDLGEVSLIPPVLTLQYHFTPRATFSPYLGAGINYTIFYDEKRSSAITGVDYENSLGYALQAGFDYAIDDRWSVNFDVKKVWVDTDITVSGGAVNAPGVDLDPWVLSVGFGYRF